MTRSLSLSALKPALILAALAVLLAGCHVHRIVHHGPRYGPPGQYKYGHPGRGRGRYRLHMVTPGMEIELDD